MAKHAVITMDQVRAYGEVVEKRKKSTTVEEAKARLIASGALDKDGKPRVYPKVVERQRKETK